MNNKPRYDPISGEDYIGHLQAEVDRLKKQVADLEKPAAFGHQCYQDHCENAYIEESVVKRLVKEAAEKCAALIETRYKEYVWHQSVAEDIRKEFGLV